MFKVAGADRIMTVDLHHLPRSRASFRRAGRPTLWAIAAARGLHPGTNYSDQEIAGSVSPGLRAGFGLAERWSEMLGGCPLAFHPQDPRPAQTQRGPWPTGSSAEIAGRTCVVIDDMIDTGGTIAGTVQGGTRRRRRRPTW